MEEQKQQLKEILGSMDIPESRKNDLGWLARNLVIRNSHHARFEEAMKIIKVLLKK